MLIRINHNPKRKSVSEEPAIKSLAYATGCEKQPAFELLFAISTAVMRFSKNSIAHE